MLTVVKEATGEMRWGLFAILMFFIGGAVLLYFVNTRKGGLEAANFHIAAEVHIEELVAENPGLVSVLRLQQVDSFKFAFNALLSVENRRTRTHRECSGRKGVASSNADSIQETRITSRS